MKNPLFTCALGVAIISSLGMGPGSSSEVDVWVGTPQEPRKVKPADKRAKPQTTGQKPVRQTPQDAAAKRAARAKAKKAKKAKEKREAAQTLGRPEKVTPPAAKQPDEIGLALAELERKAGAGQATGADLKAIGQRIAAATTGAPNKVAWERLRRTLGDLEQRAQRAPLTPQDMALLNEQWIDTRIDFELRALAVRAGRQPLSPAYFEPMGTLLQKRAQASKGMDPTADATRDRLQAILSRLREVSRGRQVLVTDLEVLRAGLNAARLERAMSDLERRSLSKTASPADVARVNDRINDHASGSNVDPKLAEKLRKAIASLEARALRGEVTREEFAELRAGLTKRARNAAKEK